MSSDLIHRHLAEALALGGFGIEAAAKPVAGSGRVMWRSWPFWRPIRSSSPASADLAGLLVAPRRDRFLGFGACLCLRRLGLGADRRWLRWGTGLGPGMGLDEVAVRSMGPGPLARPGLPHAPVAARYRLDRRDSVQLGRSCRLTCPLVGHCCIGGQELLGQHRVVLGQAAGGHAEGLRFARTSTSRSVPSTGAGSACRAQHRRPVRTREPVVPFRGPSMTALSTVWMKESKTLVTPCTAARSCSCARRFMPVDPRERPTPTTPMSTRCGLSRSTFRMSRQTRSRPSRLPGIHPCWNDDLPSGGHDHVLQHLFSWRSVDQDEVVVGGERRCHSVEGPRRRRGRQLRPFGSGHRWSLHPSPRWV